jgi:hypothetical protein
LPKIRKATNDRQLEKERKIMQEELNKAKEELNKTAEELNKTNEERKIMQEELNKAAEELNKTTEKLNDLKNIKTWLEQKSKGNVSYKLYDDQDGVIYFGSNLLDACCYMFKIGKTISARVDRRKGQLSTGLSPHSGFKIFENFKVASSLANNFESYIHELLKPLQIDVDNNSSREFFLGSPEWMIMFIKNRIRDQQGAIKEVNDYLNLVMKYEYNLDKTRLEVCELYDLPVIDLDSLKRESQQAATKKANVKVQPAPAESVNRSENIK